MRNRNWSHNFIKVIFLSLNLLLSRAPTADPAPPSLRKYPTFSLLSVIMSNDLYAVAGNILDRVNNKGSDFNYLNICECIIDFCLIPMGTGEPSV